VDVLITKMSTYQEVCSSLMLCTSEPVLLSYIIIFSSSLFLSEAVDLTCTFGVRIWAGVQKNGL